MHFHNTDVQKPCDALFQEKIIKNISQHYISHVRRQWTQCNAKLYAALRGMWVKRENV